MIIKVPIDDFDLDKLVELLIERLKIDEKIENMNDGNLDWLEFDKKFLEKEVNLFADLDNSEISEVFDKLGQYVEQKCSSIRTFHVNDQWDGEFLVITNTGAHPDPVGPTGEPAIQFSKKKRKFHGDSKKSRKGEKIYG